MGWEKYQRRRPNGLFNFIVTGGHIGASQLLAFSHPTQHLDHATLK
jgi:hypothetical protein